MKQDVTQARAAQAQYQKGIDVWTYIDNLLTTESTDLNVFIIHILDTNCNAFFYKFLKNNDELKMVFNYWSKRNELPLLPHNTLQFYKKLVSVFCGFENLDYRKMIWSKIDSVFVISEHNSQSKNWYDGLNAVKNHPAILPGKQDEFRFKMNRFILTAK